MNMYLPNKQKSPAGRHLAAGTLLEMMFAVAIMVMIVMALMSAHLLGLREYQLVDSKCGASDMSRRVLNNLPVDIRSSKMWQIGNVAGTNFAFTALANGSSQLGTALKLFPTTNNSRPYIEYYFNLAGSNNSDGRLMRFSVDSNGVSSATTCLASNLVDWLGNGYSFVAEDYNGNLQSDAGNSAAFKNVIHTKLQFCQFQYPLTPVGTNGLYDFYKLEFKATPHLPE